MNYNEPPAAIAEFSKEFTLRRSNAVRFQDFLARSYDLLLGMETAKIRSDFVERVRAAKTEEKSLKVECELRDLAIRGAKVFSLEEWAGIFRDAVLAGDCKFVKEIIDEHEARPTFDARFEAIRCFWPGFQLAGLANKVPPLKHWRDKAAAEFVRFITGQKSLQLWTYQQRKQQLELRCEKLKLVTWAEYTQRDGEDGEMIHYLECRH